MGKTAFSNRGFTLVELLIGLSVAVILATVAIPYFSKFLPNRELTSMSQEVLGQMRRARMEAATGGIPCTVVFRARIAGVDYDLAIFADENGNRIFDPNDRLLSGLVAGTYTNAFLAPNEGGGDGVNFGNNTLGQPALRWNFRGRPHMAGRVFLANTDGHTRAIGITMAGAARIQ